MSALTTTKTLVTAPDCNKENAITNKNTNNVSMMPLGTPKCVISVPTGHVSSVHGGTPVPTTTKVTLRSHPGGNRNVNANSRVSSNCSGSRSSKLDFLMDLQNKHRFSVAISRQNEVASAAIKSLDCLNDQIVQYIVSGHCGGGTISSTSSKNGRHHHHHHHHQHHQQQHHHNLEDIINNSVNNNNSSSSSNNLNLSTSSGGSGSGTTQDEDEHVHESMVLIRGLLHDAQAKFRSMVEDNRQLAAHIDGSIRAANQEVGMLRAELASTNKRLSQISFKDSMGKADVAVQVGKALADPKKDEAEITIQTLRAANQQLLEDYKKLLEDHDVVKVTIMDTKEENDKLKADNSRLEADYANVVRENEDIRQIKADKGEGGKGKPSYGELKLELIQTRQELNRAKEVLQELKSDRKRLKGEKLDLLSQMKQLYATLEDKETELRDFIRNYEQRVKESDDMIKQVDMLAREKEETDHEKWDIITKARDAAEKAMFFRGQLDSKEQQVKTLEAELAEAKRMLGNLGHSFPSPTLALSTSMGSSSHSTDALLNNSDSYSISSTGEDSCLLNFQMPPANSTPSGVLGMKGLTASTPVMTSSTEGLQPPTLQRMCSETSTISEIESDGLSRSSASRSSGGKTEEGKKKKKAFTGFTRVFSRNRLRRSVALTKDETESMGLMPSCAKLSVLNEDNYQEKLSIVEHMVGVSMLEWRAHQVLAWLEITLAMPMYAIACLHNIKSGRVLLGLSDSELSAALGVSNHIHRRKLRLSIEQHRNPNEIKYPKANEMDPTWIAHRFLPDLGLPQYTRIFEEQLCDGHIINSLTRKDLEKYFSVHRKFHQSSITHAVELLRRIEFNKEKLYKRRTQSDETDTDLIVWTNERLMKWIRSIDLGEYGDNLKESGVHGALIVLEPSFCSDSLSSILGIPPSKSYIRRHLDAELDTVLKPARAALDTPEVKGEPDEDSSQSKKKLLQRGSSQEDAKTTRLSFRGSIGKAFGKKAKNESKKGQDSSAKTISGPIPIQHSSLSALDTSSELLKKGFCLPGQCIKPGGGNSASGGGGSQGSESDLQKSFNALSILQLQQKQRASSEEKIPSRRLEERSSTRPNVIDFVRDLKKEADLKNGNNNNNNPSSPTIIRTNYDADVESKTSTLTKKDNNNQEKGGGSSSSSSTSSGPKVASNSVAHLSPSEAAGEASLVSSSSQDTLTENTVNIPPSPSSEEMTTTSREKEQNSQTESLSQSSSTESTLEDNKPSSSGSNKSPSHSRNSGSSQHHVLLSGKDKFSSVKGSSSSSSKRNCHSTSEVCLPSSNVEKLEHEESGMRSNDSKSGQKVRSSSSSDCNRKRSSFKEGFHSTPV